MAGIIPEGMTAQSFGRAQDVHPSLYFQEKTLKKIMRWATEYNNFCAILYGVYGEQDGVIISGACRVKKAKRQMGHLFFSGKTWRSIKEQKKEKYPRLDMVGICMVQKKGECRIPTDLLTIAKGYFSEKWQVVLAVDSHSWRCRFYQWDEENLKPAPGYYLVKKQDEDGLSVEDSIQMDQPVSLEKDVTSPLPSESIEEENDVLPEVCPSGPSQHFSSQIPENLVDEVRSYGRRVRLLTALVTVMFVAVLGTGIVLGVRQATLAQPVWVQQAELESRVAHLEDKTQQDDPIDDQIAQLKQQLSDLEGKTGQQEQLIRTLSDQIQQLEKKLSQPSSSGQDVLPDYHTVQPGETLTSISIRYFGTPDKAGYLAAINDLQNPDVVQAGAVLRLSE
ncbi:bifunctional uroporphyrinogen-III synthetase/uroporphyrin-III C-methyltransferase [Eubacteriaceae bacterium CHKCI005]|nr:bifunctional uroporphyrinogen-III synthetase/uroporphyrin-III C-methyltransferase [Eubacteriaceae bacterium CHKCI005]